MDLSYGHIKNLLRLWNFPEIADGARLCRKNLGGFSHGPFVASPDRRGARTHSLPEESLTWPIGATALSELPWAVARTKSGRPRDSRKRQDGRAENDGRQSSGVSRAGNAKWTQQIGTRATLPFVSTWNVYVPRLAADRVWTVASPPMSVATSAGAPHASGPPTPRSPLSTMSRSERRRTDG